MKDKLKKSVRITFMLSGAVMLFPMQAEAYVDPATTSYVVQIVAGIVIACGTGIGIFWNRMRRKMKKKNEGEPEASPERETTGGVMTAADLLEDDDTDKQS